MRAAERLSRSDLEGLLRFVASVEECDDAPSLRERIMNGLTELVGPDSVGYTEIDNASGAAEFWTDPTEIAGLADEEAFVALLEQHPIAAYHQAHGGRHAVQFGDFLSKHELHGLELYNDFYRPLDVEHQLAIAVDAPGGLTMPIAVHRRSGEFSERERAVMALLHPHLENAHRRLAARVAAERMLEAIAAARGTALISLGDGDRIELATGSALTWLHRYFDANGAAADRLPAGLSAWLEAVRTRNGDVRASGDDVERLLIGGPASRLSIRYLRAMSRWEDDILLLEEHRVRIDPAELRRRGLTPRETEVLICAADGRTDNEIARELGVSTRTVQKHLQAVFRKLGVINRTAAVARALEAPELSEL